MRIHSGVCQVAALDAVTGFLSSQQLLLNYHVQARLEIKLVYNRSRPGAHVLVTQPVPVAMVVSLQCIERSCYPCMPSHVNVALMRHAKSMQIQSRPRRSCMCKYFSISVPFARADADYLDL